VGSALAAGGVFLGFGCSQQVWTATSFRGVVVLITVGGMNGLVYPAR
jgi:hypothetical protein